MGSLFGKCFQGISLLHHGMSQFLKVARRKRFQRAGDFIWYTVQDDTLSSFGQGTTSGLPLYPKRQCRRSASLPFWVKFIFSPWCIIIVRHGGHVRRDFFCFLFPRFAVSLSSSNLFFSSFDASFDPLSQVSRDLFIRASIALGPSEGASLMHTHSSKWAFFKVSSIGIYNERFDPLCGLSLLSCCQVLVWHHCRQVFTGCSASQLRPLPFFPPGCTFLVATTIACCLCHLVRVTSAIAVGKVRNLPGDS